MIRFKDKILEDYFIDPKTAIITDKNGVVQQTYLHQGTETFKKMAVHCIMAHTYLGYFEGCHVHHLDENHQNNILSNLVVLTAGEHSSLHQKSRVVNEEYKLKIKEGNKKTWSDPLLREKHSQIMKLTHESPEYLQKQSVSQKKSWQNEEIRNKRIAAMNSPESKQKFLESMAKVKKSPDYGCKISEHLKKFWSSQEARKRQSEKISGMLWWNNGETSKRSREWPGEGWTKGRIMKTKKEKV